MPFEFNPSKSIGKTPFSENALSKCVDTDTIPGAARINMATENTNSASIDLSAADTFIRDANYRIETSTDHEDWVTGTAALLTTTGTLPSGLSTGTTYFLRQVRNDYYSLHASFSDAQTGASEIEMTDAGTGTHTITPVEMKEPIKFLNDRMMDTDGTFWAWSTSYSSWYVLSPGDGSGEGFQEWQGYAFLFRESNIDTYRLSDGTLTSAWQSDSGGPSIVGQDDTIYIGVGNNIASIARGAGSFNPASGATYTYSSSALDLPEGDTVTCISEVGRFIAIGTVKDKLYLWDRVSSSFELPVLLPDTPRILVQVLNSLYCVLDNGDIVASDGASYRTVLRFPRYILNTNQETPSFTIRENAWRVEDNKVFIGYGSTSTTDQMGVYSYEVTTGDFKIEHISSDDSIGGAASTRVRIPAIQNGDIFFIAFTVGGSTYNIDKVSTSNKYASSQAEVISPMRVVGKKNNKTAYKHHEIQLAEKLQDNQSITLYYRTDLNEGWTTIGTFNTAGKASEVIDKTVQDLEKYQLRAVMDTQGTTTPSLLYVISEE